MSQQRIEEAADGENAPQNIILYGPPGTGKTYVTTRRCVEICDGSAERLDEEIRYEEIRCRYNELVESGRVEFITFHQSYGYEEFVEGYVQIRVERSSSRGYVQIRVERSSSRGYVQIRVEMKGTTALVSASSRLKVY